MKIYLYKSRNPQWTFEVYDWNCKFSGYMGFITNKKNILCNNIKLQ